MNAGGRRRFSTLCALAACVLMTFSAEARANGNISADAPAPVPYETGKKTVRKAPVRRPAVKKAATQPAARKPALPDPPLPTSLERGIELMQQERYGQARPWLQKALQEERRNPWAWYWYGKVHEEMGEFQQSQFFYTKALELDAAFPPLSRVAAWPAEDGRNPLWDPRRPARVYSIPTNDHGIVIVPPDSPQATSRPGLPPADPELPQVPVYVPPEPASTLFPGQAQPPVPVYVPPTAEQAREY